jgi:hypothetical protein
MTNYGVVRMIYPISLLPTVLIIAMFLLLGDQHHVQANNVEIGVDEL